MCVCVLRFGGSGRCETFNVTLIHLFYSAYSVAWFHFISNVRIYESECEPNSNIGDDLRTKENTDNEYNALSEMMMVTMLMVVTLYW